MTLPEDPLKWAITAFRDGRNQAYSQLQEYIDGKQPLQFATLKFRSAFGALFEAFAYNRCELVVDAHADRLQIESFSAPDDGLAQRAQQLWDENRMDMREGHVTSDAIGLGDSYVIVEMHPVTGNVHIWVKDPRQVRVHYSDEVPGEIDLAVCAWVTDDKYRRVNLYFVDRVEKYISRRKISGDLPHRPSAYERFEVGGAWSFPLNVPGTVPVFPFANNGRTNQYGRSELSAVLPLQDALNKTLMDMLLAMEFSAFPQRILIGVDADDDESRQKLTRFQAGLDRVLTLFSDQAKATEFSAVNIAQYLGVAEFMDKTISRVTKIPVHYLSMEGSFPSGRALRLAEGPFVSKIEDRQRNFGYGWSEVVRYGLRLATGSEIDSGAIRVNWQSAAPLSEEDQLEMAMRKQSLGVSVEETLRELGYSEEELAKILDEKAASADRAQQAFNRGVIPFRTDSEPAA